MASKALNPNQLARAAMTRANQMSTLGHAIDAVNDVLHLTFYTEDGMAQDFAGALRQAMREMELQSDRLAEANRAMIEDAMELAAIAERMAAQPQ